MRRQILFALILLAAVACQGGTGESKSAEAHELLQAVPSDALAVGVFGRCDHAIDRMLDSASVLRGLDYGKLSRNRAVVAFCDLGSIVPLLIVETGKALPGEGLRAATDTLTQTAELAALADSMKLFSAQLALSKHNILLVSQSPTLITVVKRHMTECASILDAPYFEDALDAMGGSSDAIAWRNSGAAKLFRREICSIPRKQVAAFLKGAAEWTVATGDKLHTVQPQAERYFCNFLGDNEAGQSKLGSFFPEQAALVIDLPIKDLRHWRQSYETLMDARVELEAYNKRLQALKKSAGKNPLDWEKELDVQEVAFVAAPGYALNLVRCGKSGKGSGVQPNPSCGFVRALYGEPFNAADSCCIRVGKWLVSGPRAVLDTLEITTNRNWPSEAVATVQADGSRLTWTKENIILWQDSNR